MKIKEKVIQQVLDGFQRLKGRASFYCFTKDIIPDIVFCFVVNEFRLWKWDMVKIDLSENMNKITVIISELKIMYSN